MTVMQFDSHRGWYRPYGEPAHISNERPAWMIRTADRPEPKANENDFLALLDKARNGDFEAMAKLKAMGPRPQGW